MLASISTSLPWIHTREKTRKGSLGRLLRGQAGRKTGRGTGAKEFKSRRAKRLGWRLRERLSLRAPRCLLGSFQFSRLSRFYTTYVPRRESAPHIPQFER